MKAPESGESRGTGGAEATVVRVVLVGFAGAGKSTVGPIVARGLGWGFVDLDAEVARREGRPPGEIIRERGMAPFRRIEYRAGSDVLRRTRVVVAAGGGWAAEPNRLASLGRGSLSVWLHVTPETALARIEGSSESRPLLEGADPRAAAEMLLRGRTAYYRRSDVTIETEGRSPEEVARAILEDPLVAQVYHAGCPPASGRPGTGR